MLKILAPLALAFVMLAAWPTRGQAPADLVREFDRFKNRTTLTIPAFDLLDASGQRVGLQLEATGEHAGERPTQRPDRDDAVLLTVTPDGYKRPEGDKALDLLADGAPIPLRGSLSPHLSAQVVAIIEWIGIREYERLIKAKVVEGRAYGREFQLTPSQLSALRELYSRLYPPAGRPVG